MTSLPTQEQIWTNAADAAQRAANALSDVRDWLQSDWSDTKTLTDEAANARIAARGRLEDLKAEIYQIEAKLRDGAKSLRERR